MSAVRCQGCPSSAKVVGGEWKRRAPGKVLMVIGMNPGRMEVNMGSPFVGPSGRLLREALRGWGGSIYVTNAVKCGEKGANVRREHVEACLGTLVGEVLSVRPDVILVLGEVAYSAYTRLRDAGVVDPNTVVVKHSHPAVSLHGGGIRQGAWIQSCAAAVVKAISGEPEVRILEYRGEDLPPILSSDTEYAGPVWNGPSLWCVSDGGSVWVLHPSGCDPRGTLRGRVVIFHHAVNELMALMGCGADMPLEIHDTMVLSALDDEEGPRDLKTLAAVKLQYTYEVPKRAEKVDVTYCSHDARATYLLYDRFYKGFAEKSWLYNSLYRPIAPILAGMGFRGVRVDVERAKQRLGEVEREIRAVDEELRRFASINWSSDDQVAFYMKSKGYPLGKQTNSGARPSVGKDALIPLARAGVVEAELVLRRRALVKERSTYLKPLIESGGVIRTIYNPVGTETGRISSGSGGERGAMNLQNIPKHLRYLLLPPEGMVWVEADASQHEVRTLAWLAEQGSAKRPLVTALQDSDFYRSMARMFMGRSPTDEERDVFKTVLLAAQYLATPRTIQSHLEREGIYLDVKHIQRMMEFIDGRFPTVRRWREAMFRQARETGMVTTPLGRRRRVYVGPGGVLSPETRRIVVNSPVQGCLPADTRILTPEGWVPIGRWESGLVWTGERWAAAIRLARGEATRLRLHLSDGRTFDCDDRHYLLVQDGVWPRWVSVKEIVGLPLVRDTGTKWGIARRSVEDWYWAGRFLGDGWLGERRWKMAFGDREVDAIQRFKEWLDAAGIKGKTNSRRGWFVYKHPHSRSLAVGGATEAGIALWETLGFKRGDTARTKRIPPVVFTLDFERRAAFFRGYFDADGTPRTRRHRGEKITSVNKSLLEDTLRLLQTLGRSGKIGGPWKNQSGVEWFDLQIHVSPQPLTVLRVEELAREPMYTLSVDDERHAFSSEGLISKNTASDLILFGLLRAYRAGVRPILTVHDSISAAAYPDEVRDVAWTLKRAIEDEPLLGAEMMGLLKVKVKAGPSYGELEEVKFA